MQIKLSPDEIETIIREANTAARRLQRKLCLPICEREDLGQELLVDLLRRLPAYDRSRGSIGAFAGIVLRNQSSRIAMRHRRQRRAQGGTMLSLELPLAGAHEPVGAILTESEGLAAWHGQNCCAVALAEQNHALQTALAHLTANDRCFCAALAHRPITALTGMGFGNRSKIYRRIADLRHVLTTYGLGPSWDSFETA